MARTLSDGRERIIGLDVSGVSLGARADLRSARIEAQGIELKLRDLDRLPGSRHGRLTRELWSRPSASTFLSSVAAPTDTTLEVYATDSFASAGTVHIGTEAIRYTSKDATHFYGCTRGSWDTIAQRHFVADGEGLADAKVTDRPASIEGRRVYVTLYGDGDDPQGNGHARWRGVCATDLKWEKGEWTLGVDPITRLLSQPIGSSSSDELRLRGIHYGVRHPWVLLISQPSSGKTAVASIVGFYETEVAFCAAATTAVATALSDATISLGATGTLTVDPMVSGYRITYTAHSSGAPHELAVTVSPSYVPSPSGFDRVALGVGTSLEPSASLDLTPDNGASEALEVPASFPRGAIGARAAYAPAGLFGDDQSWARVYLATYAVPTSGSALAVKDGDEERVFTVASADVGTRSVQLAATGSGSHFGPDTRFVLGTAIGYGTVVDMLTSVTSLSPDLANGGAMPLLGSTDITWTQDVTDALESSPLCSGRRWTAFDQSTLADLIEPELIALGAYMRLSLTGQIEIDMLRPALATDAAAWTVDDSQTGPTIERGSYGTLGLVRYHYDYNPREDEWGSSIAFRDVQNASATRAPIETDVKQRSATGGLSSSGTFFPGVPPELESIARLAVNQFAFFGTDYSVIQTSVDPRYLDARIGDVVAYSSSLLPDTADGTSAIAARGVRIVGASLELASGRVQLEMILHAERFAGYHFGALIDSASVVAGFTYDLTLEGGYSETDATHHCYAGMSVVAVEGDSAAPTSVTGSVVSVQSGTVVRVAFPSAPSFVGEWVLRAGPSTNFEDGDQGAKLTFVAFASARIDYGSTSVAAQVFS